MESWLKQPAGARERMRNESRGECTVRQRARSAMAAKSRPRPKPNDKILVLKEAWLALILSGEKTLEIRGTPLHAGQYWLGCKKQIYARAFLGNREGEGKRG